MSEGGSQPQQQCEDSLHIDQLRRNIPSTSRPKNNYSVASLFVIPNVVFLFIFVKRPDDTIFFAPHLNYYRHHFTYLSKINNFFEKN